MTNATIIELIKNYVSKRFKLDIDLKYVTSWHCNIKNKKNIYDINVTNSDCKIHVSCKIVANGFLSKLELANPKTKVNISNFYFGNGYGYNPENKEVM